MKIESLGNFERVDRNAEVMDTPYDRWVESQGVDVIRATSSRTSRKCR